MVRAYSEGHSNKTLLLQVKIPGLSSEIENETTKARFPWNNILTGLSRLMQKMVSNQIFGCVLSIEKFKVELGRVPFDITKRKVN